MRPLPRVLLLNEEPLDAEVLTTLLELAGYAVDTELPDGDAVARALAANADAVILNVTKPGEAGIAPLRDLRASPATRHLKLICLSGWVTDEDRECAIAAGCDRFLAKPYRPEEILKALQELTAA